MTYDRTAQLLGAGTVSAAAIDGWFHAHGNAPSGLGQAIIDESDGWGTGRIVNHDLVAAQIAHETGYWTSAIAHDKNNPAGLGAINSSAYASAITFASPQVGIHAQIAHLLSYVLGAGAWGADDPRYAAVVAAQWLGSVKTLADLEQKWAYSDPATYAATPESQRYGGMVAAHANSLLAFAQQTGGSVAGDDPRFAWTPDTQEFGYPADPNANNPGGIHGRNGQPVELLILHITAGTDSQSWLVGGHGSSTHYLTRQDGAPRAQHVAEADAAWTPGSRDYALRSINVEVEMLHTTDWTDAIMREVARTIAPIMQRNGIPAVYLGRDNGTGKRGMIGHRDVPDGVGGFGGSSHHDDPGAAFDWPKFEGMVKAELASGVVIPPDAGDAVTFPEVPYKIVLGFAGFWREVNPGLRLYLLGFPTGEERAVLTIPDVGSAQPFQRAWLVWQPKETPSVTVATRALQRALEQEFGEAA